MRRASPNPLTERSVIVAPRKALKFTAAPNPQRMSREFDGFGAETDCFTPHFHPRAKRKCALSRTRWKLLRSSHRRPARVFLFKPKCLPDFLKTSQFASSTPLFHPVNKIDAVSLYDLAILTILGRTYNNGASRGFSSIRKMNKLGLGSSLNC
jgi:hypothetical protein